MDHYQIVLRNFLVTLKDQEDYGATEHPWIPYKKVWIQVMENGPLFFLLIRCRYF